ncbi:MAG: hypothetical protein K1X83_00245 [Oligoflexia bacterium]|nr:hypothetical protein [Oligoflexia bacterium]
MPSQHHNTRVGAALLLTASLITSCLPRTPVNRDTSGDDSRAGAAAGRLMGRSETTRTFAAVGVDETFSDIAHPSLLADLQISPIVIPNSDSLRVLGQLGVSQGAFTPLMLEDLFNPKLPLALREAYQRALVKLVAEDNGARIVEARQHVLNLYKPLIQNGRITQEQAESLSRPVCLYYDPLSLAFDESFAQVRNRPAAVYLNNLAVADKHEDYYFGENTGNSVELWRAQPFGEQLAVLNQLLEAGSHLSQAERLDAHARHTRMQRVLNTALASAAR